MFGEFTTLMPHLREDRERFFLYFRMYPECFDVILDGIDEEIRKMPTNFRNPISPAERIAIEINFQ
jgi:hypothetical protein